MPDRKAMDRPATAILAVSGLLFIGLSVPFIPAAYCNLPVHNSDLCGDVAAPSPVVFDVTWASSALPAEDLTVTAAGTARGDGQVTLNVTGFQGDVTVEVTACDDDDFTDPVQQPASVTYVLSNSSGEMHSATFACTALPPVFVFSQPAPDVAQVTALNATAAREELLSNPKVREQTVTYTLTITTTRPSTIPPGTLPPTQLDPTVTVSAKLTASSWAYAINPRPAEVPK